MCAISLGLHSFHIVVNAVAQIDVKVPWLTKECFVDRGAAVVAACGGLVLGIRLRFHNHAPQRLATFVALHQQAGGELAGYDFCRAAEEGLGNKRMS